MKHNLYSLLFLALCGIVLLAPACKSDGPDVPERAKSLTPSPVTHHPYKIIEDEHVVIIRNGERFDITGRKLE